MKNSGGEDQEMQAEDVTEEVAATVREYSSQADYVTRVSAAANTRTQEVREALRAAFAAAIRIEELEVVDFHALSVMDLAGALERYPLTLKPLLAVCNIAGRAIERDLELRN